MPATGTDGDGCRSSQAQASVAGLIAALAIVLARDRVNASLQPGSPGDAAMRLARQWRAPEWLGVV